MYRDRRFGFELHITPMVKRLLIANGAVFVVTMLIGEALMFDLFGLQPRQVLVRPWGLFTYMFLHAGFWHLFMNMLVLFFFGPPLESRWGEREFLRFYIISGLGGAALSLLFMPGMVVGASAAIYGLMLAFALNWPNAPIYIYGVLPVKAKWLVSFLFVLAVVGTFGSSQSSTAHFAHLGGALAAFAYLKLDWRPGAALARLRRSGSGRAPRPLAIVPRDLDGPSRTSSGDAAGASMGRRPASAGVGAAGAASASSGRSEPSRPAETREEQTMLDEVDRVLDKISAQGMASLTAAERKLLDEVSRRRRTH